MTATVTTALTETIGVWTHSLAALLFAGTAFWQADRWRDRAARSVIVACIMTALWALAVAALGTGSALAQLGESVRNFAWLSFVYALLGRSGTEHRSLRILYAVLAFTVTATAISNIIDLLDPQLSASIPTLAASTFLLRIAYAVGGLAAVHNLYTATTAGARGGVGLPLAILGVLWGVDLTFYALCWVQGGWAVEFAGVRGIVAVVLGPLIALAARRNLDWTIRLSRTVAFRSVGLVAALTYLALVIATAQGLEALGGQGAQIVAPLVMLAAGLLVAIGMLSPRLRAWSNVMLAKHMFAHRYDYRAEWLRFTDTLGVPGAGTSPLEVRVIKAIADIVQSPGGALLLPMETGLATVARWGWPTLPAPSEPDDGPLAGLLGTARIVTLDALRDGADDAADVAAVPEWIMADTAAWAIVPLVHFDRLVGAVLLERPLVARSLDWEDFDLLRLAGRQVASYLAEATAQEALGEAARFDEFNRRFAFIIHDIKNLVSQLTLVTRNAERHADKPEFRVDMIATLQSSTSRMNELLARLSQRNTMRVAEVQAVALGDSVARVAAGQRLRHPVVVQGAFDLGAVADPARFEQALSHIVANAVDASPATEPVVITLTVSADEAAIEVADKGCGMSADFVRGALFRPFASTKDTGFGVGAYEARALIVAMGGRLTVASATGEGTRMTIWLPRAEASPARRAA